MTDKSVERDVLEAVRPYELRPQDKVIVDQLKKPGHKPCTGTGVVGWQHNGRVAILCGCVRKRAAAIEPELEKLERHVKAQIVQAKLDQRWHRRLARWLRATWDRIVRRTKTA